MSTKYRTIVADPPWDYADTSAGSGLWDRQVSRAGSHYDQLSLADICRLPVKDLVADDAYCFLWIPNRQLLEGFAKPVLEAWGFRPITTYAWCKTQPGLGYYIRNSHENVAFGVRGSPGRFNTFFNSWQTSPRTRHSAKPNSFYELVEDACDGPYLELFARSQRPGWTTWGKETTGSLDLTFDPALWEPTEADLLGMSRPESAFWPVYVELVELLWSTEKADRLGIVVPYLEDRFGPQYSNIYEQIEGNLLRTVIFLEQLRTIEDLTDGK